MTQEEEVEDSLDPHYHFYDKGQRYYCGKTYYWSSPPFSLSLPNCKKCWAIMEPNRPYRP